MSIGRKKFPSDAGMPGNDKKKNLYHSVDGKERIVGPFGDELSRGDKIEAHQ